LMRCARAHAHTHTPHSNPHTHTHTHTHTITGEHLLVQRRCCMTLRKAFAHYSTTVSTFACYSTTVRLDAAKERGIERLSLNAGRPLLWFSFQFVCFSNWNVLVCSESFPSRSLYGGNSCSRRALEQTPILRESTYVKVRNKRGGNNGKPVAEHLTFIPS
jgi:hypothetical protein